MQVERDLVEDLRHKGRPASAANGVVKLLERASVYRPELVDQTHFLVIPLLGRIVKRNVGMALEILNRRK